MFNSAVRRSRPALPAALALAAVLAGVAAPAWAAPAEPSGKTEKPAAAAVKRVEPKTVCMVTDHAMGKPQLAVAVEGRTYYGCCAMCKGRLAKDAEVRSAVDPVTGKKVDKAKAVIAAREDGTVLYFESEKSLAAYQARAGQGENQAKAAQGSGGSR
jgi:YHS domain-containing protein